MEETTNQRISILERVMKLPYIKQQRDTEEGVIRFVARDDVISALHAEQLERAQPATPACAHFWSEGNKAFGCVLPKGHGGDHSAFAQPPVAAQGTDGLLRELLEKWITHPEDYSAEGVARMTKQLLVSHDASLLRQRDREWVDEIEDRLHFGTLPPETLENTKGQLDIWVNEHDAALIARTREPLESLLREVLELYPQKFSCSYGSREYAHIEPQDWIDIRTKIEAALAHTEKASQPHEPGCSALAALNPEERICDCRAAQQTEGKQP